MGGEDSEQALEQQTDVDTGQTDVLFKEADAGRSAFVEAEKERAQFLKRGGSSGISQGIQMRLPGWLPIWPRPGPTALKTGPW